MIVGDNFEALKTEVFDQLDLMEIIEDRHGRFCFQSPAFPRLYQSAFPKGRLYRSTVCRMAW